MKKMTEIRKIALLAGIALAAVGSVNQAKAGGSAEILYGTDQDNDEHSTLDVKVSGALAPQMAFFARSRNNVDYTGNVNAFTLVDVSYKAAEGIYVVGEMQFVPGAKVDSRIGIQGQGSLGDLFGYGLVTRNFNEKPNTECTGIVAFTPQLGDDIRGMLRWEEIINRGDNGDQYDIARIRVGLSYGALTAGAAADISGIGSGKSMSRVVGGFVKMEF